ncbi:hypothetical protein [Leucobacter sp. GX24907]
MREDGKARENDETPDPVDRIPLTNDDALEPPIDPDSRERLNEEIPDAPHPPGRYDAGTGQGTAANPPRGDDTQDRPILDGSTQSPIAEASVPNPYRGQADPALVSRQPALNTTRTNRWLYASMIAATIVTIALLVLARWNPVWCGVGVVVALVALLLMLIVRASGLGRRARLRVEALLMAVLWLGPLAIILWTMIGSADEIWG